MNGNSLVVKSNKVVEASYRLTLNEQRLILACITQIKRKRVISADDRFEVSAAEFADVFELPLDQAYRELQTVAERLYERSVTIQNPDPDDPRISHTKTRWVSAIDYLPGNGLLVLRFASRMIPYISMLEGNFTLYRLEAVARMSSAYSIRLYELLIQWRGERKREITLNELKSILQLEGRYPAIKDFKVRVLHPALKDINEHSDLQASYTQRKTGRVITHLVFSFQPKPAKRDKKTAAKISKAEIERHARPGETYAEVETRLRASREKS